MIRFVMFGGLLITLLGRPAPTLAAVSKALSTVTIAVSATNVLRVTDAGVITLDNADVDPVVSDRIGPDSNDTARLNFTHNHISAKKITAQIMNNPLGHDLTLRVEVAGGTGQKTLVSSGKTAGIQDLYNNIQAGALTDLPVTYTAECTASGTPLGSPMDFIFVVTFTSVAQ